MNLPVYYCAYCTKRAGDRKSHPADADGRCVICAGEMIGPSAAARRMRAQEEGVRLTFLGISELDGIVRQKQVARHLAALRETAYQRLTGTRTLGSD